MDTTLIGMLVTTVGTGIAVVALVSRSIGSLRSHMDGRIDALAHANQLAHDAIGARIDAHGDKLGARIDGLHTELGRRIEAQGAELGRRIETQGGRIDDLRAELGGRIDAQGSRIDVLEARVARIGDDVAFIKGRLTTQPEG